MSKKGKHEPSRYRELMRDARKGRRRKVIGHDIVTIINDARALSDPYYAALALYRLSDDMRLSPGEAATISAEALKLAVQVDRPWRRAELLCEMARRTSGWGKKRTEVDIGERRSRLYGRLADAMLAIDDEKGLSDAICNGVRYVPGKHLETFLKKALGNTDHAQGDSKAVLRAWARLTPGERKSSLPPSRIISSLREIPDTEMRARLLGYLYHQLFKLDEAALSGDIPKTFHEALSSARSMEDEGSRLETLRYLSSISEREQLEDLGGCIGSFSRPELAARLCSAAGGRADKLSTGTAVGWFERGAGLAASIGSAEERASLRFILAEGMKRSGAVDAAEEIFRMALRDCDDIPVGMGRPRMADRAARTAGRLELAVEMGLAGREVGSPEVSPGKPPLHKVDAEEDVSPEGTDGKVDAGPAVPTGPSDTELSLTPPSQDSELPVTPKSQDTELSVMAESQVSELSEPAGSLGAGHRHSLGLYNVYDGGLGQAHLRAVARAAPLCYGYGLVMVLIDFPTGNVEELVERVIRETNIGKGGRYLREMAKGGRVILAGAGELLAGSNGPANDTGEVRIIVATTSHPDTGKVTELSEIQERLGTDGSSLCLVMGLGKKGIPDYFLKGARYHLELTGKNVPLETCTVMGILAERLRGVGSG